MHRSTPNRLWTTNQSHMVQGSTSKHVFLPWWRRSYCSLWLWGRSAGPTSTSLSAYHPVCWTQSALPFLNLIEMRDVEIETAFCSPSVDVTCLPPVVPPNVTANCREGVNNTQTCDLTCDDNSTVWSSSGSANLTLQCIMQNFTWPALNDTCVPKPVISCPNDTLVSL